jgi:hypothetical protein
MRTLIFELDTSQIQINECCLILTGSIKIADVIQMVKSMSWPTCQAMKIYGRVYLHELSNLSTMV